jgi:hypothetical protein
MTRALNIACALLLLPPLLGLAFQSMHVASAASEKGISRRQLLLIPALGQYTLRATLLRPNGSGPFPLVVVNHGSSSDPNLRADYPAPSFDVVSTWFVHHGYAVALPQRLGHGQTAGPYLEDLWSM